MEIKKVYFHINGKPENTTTDMNVKDNYIMASLDYTKGIGYTWSIRPIGQYTIYDDKYGNALMNVISFGLLSSMPKEIWRECLVKCGRRGKAKEREAIEIFDSNVLAAVKNRLGYDVEKEMIL